MGRCEVVVFDWYATLAAPTADDFWTRLPELITDAGGTPDHAAIREWDERHPAAHVEHSTDEATYRAWQRARLNALFERCSIDEPERTELLDHIDATRYGRRFDIYDDVANALGSIRSQGVTLGLCSNWDWDLDRHLQANEIDGMFDFVICSASLGYRKPHTSVFEAVVTAAGTTPERIVFVGDNLHDDIGGALAHGLRAVHLSRDLSCEPHDPAPSMCIRDLEDITFLT